MVRLLVLLVLVTGSLPAVVDAKPRSKESATEKRGRAHYEKGKELVDAGRYAEALVELTRGYELTGRPLFLFNMAECARALGDTAQARDWYERYLAAEANGPFANAARARLVELTPPPAPAPEPAPSPVIPAPQTISAPAAPLDVAIREQPAPRSESHTVRNVVLVSVGVALLAGSVAIYVATRSPECGTGCIDLR